MRYNLSQGLAVVAVLGILFGSDVYSLLGSAASIAEVRQLHICYFKVSFYVKSLELGILVFSCYCGILVLTFYLFPGTHVRSGAASSAVGRGQATYFLLHFLIL